MDIENEKNKNNEFSGTRDFEEKEGKIIDLTKKACQRAYPIYWFGLRVMKDVINLLIKDATNYPDGLEKKHNKALLIILNRSVQHIESIRLLTERGLYGDSFVLIRSLMSDLSMVHYLHYRPELLDLFLDEKQEDYQVKKDFKNAFNETVIENELVNRGQVPFGSAFQLLSKASHTSSFGSQLYGSQGEKKGEYHLNYGPTFQPEKALLLMDFVAGFYSDLISAILFHRYQSKEELDTEHWSQVKFNLRKLSKDANIFAEAALKTVNMLWPNGIRKTVD